MDEEIKISLPNCQFSVEMLCPERWEGNIDGKIVETIISTTNWEIMQDLALKLLNDEVVMKISAEHAIKFWMGIVRGDVPNGLQITKPDPMVNIR